MDNLTEALTEVRDDMLQVIESGDVDLLIRRCSDIDRLLGNEAKDEDDEEGLSEEDYIEDNFYEPIDGEEEKSSE